ncbi:hypothetical protein HK100_003263 [Physocladia obscura]|uniref:Uncharacterized protein n=1 Tax=Physocladia obscura TaxID=109957 RepID=A0AAD5XDB5_9FUNG|nr:hypothetical protein HK100_003263 [Physocladia obscura]
MGSENELRTQSQSENLTQSQSTEGGNTSNTGESEVSMAARLAQWRLQREKDRPTANNQRHPPNSKLRTINYNLPKSDAPLKPQLAAPAAPASIRLVDPSTISASIKRSLSQTVNDSTNKRQTKPPIPQNPNQNKVQILSQHNLQKRSKVVFDVPASAQATTLQPLASTSPSAQKFTFTSSESYLNSTVPAETVSVANPDPTIIAVLQKELNTATQARAALERDLASLRALAVDQTCGSQRLTDLLDAKNVEVANLKESISCLNLQVTAQQTHIQTLSQDSAVKSAELGRCMQVVEFQRVRIGELTLRLATCEEEVALAAQTAAVFAERKSKMAQGLTRALDFMDQVVEFIGGNLIPTADEDWDMVDVQEYSAAQRHTDQLNRYEQSSAPVIVTTVSIETQTDELVQELSVHITRPLNLAEIPTELQNATPPPPSSLALIDALESDISALIAETAKSGQDTLEEYSVENDVHETRRLIAHAALVGVTARVDQITALHSLALLQTNNVTRTQIATLTQDVERMKKELRDCYEVVGYYEKENVELADEHAQQVAVYNEQILRLEEEVERLRDLNGAQGIELGVIRKEISDAYEVIDALEDQKKEDGRRSDESGDSNCRANALENELETSRDQINRLYVQIDALQKQNSEITEATAGQEAQTLKIQGELVTLQTEKKNLLKHLNSMELTEKVKFIETECQTNLTYYSTQEAQNALAHLKIAKLDNSVLKQELTNMRNAKAKSSAEIRTLKKQLEEFTGFKETMDKMQKEAVAGIERLLAKLKVKESMLEEAQKQIAVLEQEKEDSS